MIVSIALSQERFAIDMLRALNSSLKHRRKHVLRRLKLYGDQALVTSESRDYFVLQEIQNKYRLLQCSHKQKLVCSLSLVVTCWWSKDA